MRRAGILIFDGVEVLDFCGPFEVLSVTRLAGDRPREDPSPYEVLLVAEKESVVTTTGGMKVLPHVTTAACPPLDLLLVPGGWGTRREIDNAALIAWIGQVGRSVATLTSVCTGSMLLGKAGLLTGKRATTHWRALPWMRETFPDVTVIQDQHVVVEDGGRLMTSAGISAGIDLALRVVAMHHGEAIARATAKTMEYPFPEDNARRVIV